MSQLSEQAEKVLQEASGYVDARVEGVKVRTVKGLSQGISALSRLLLLVMLGSVLLLALSFAFVLWLGELLGSYALAAFIVSGVLLLIFAVCFLLRKRLFRNTFIPLFQDILSPETPVEEPTLEKLEDAILESDLRAKKQEELVKTRLSQARDSYTPRQILNRGLRLLGTTPIIGRNRKPTFRRVAGSLVRALIRKIKK